MSRALKLTGFQQAMGVAEPELLSHGEVQSQLHSDPQSKNDQHLSSLGRQSSIYSLTLDEFQHTLCEGGKNFGSMNMDEFLTSIWNAEENQAINSSQIHNNNTSHRDNNSNNNHAAHLSGSESSTERKITKQPSLPRQGSLTIPAPLCRKTVDEVWSEIHRGRQQQSRNNQSKNDDNMQNAESAPRQPTFGEMTLEDFLVKAGVVREPCTIPVAATQQQKQHYATYPATSPSVGPPFTPVIGITGGGSNNGSSNVIAPYPQVSQSSGPIWEGSGTGYQQQVPPSASVCYGGRMVNGGAGYPAAPATIGIPAPLSPVSSEGLCTSQVDNSTTQYGMDMDALRGRKRMVDGPVEKVVERRQRRMIKNRESAARSRARKQAYTVELEAELNQLREENAQLRQALAELERKRKQQYLEEAKMKVASTGQKNRDRLRRFRRNLSCPL